MSGERGKRAAGAVVGTACLPCPLLKERSSGFNGGGDRWAGRKMSGPAGAVAGTACLTVPVAKIY